MGACPVKNEEGQFRREKNRGCARARVRTQEMAIAIHAARELP